MIPKEWLRPLRIITPILSLFGFCAWWFFNRTSAPREDFYFYAVMYGLPVVLTFTKWAEWSILVNGLTLMGVFLAIFNPSAWWGFVLCFFAGAGLQGIIIGFLMKRKPRSGILGSAAWAESIGNHATPSGFRLGYFGKKATPFYQGGHILTCAPSGAGKGIGAVIPNLLEYRGSVFCVDIKGENYCVTIKARESMGQKCVLVDPFGVVADAPERDGFNPFDWLALWPDDLTADSQMIADALTVSEKDGDFWTDSARDVIRGVVAHVASFDEGRRNLGEVRRILTLSRADLADEVDRMKLSALPVVARMGNNLEAMDEKTRAGVLTTAQQQTAFLDEPRIDSVLRSSSFSLADFKAGRLSIFLVLPPERMASSFRLIRLFISLTITAVTRIKERPEFPALFLFDEFAQLGRMAIVEDTLSLIRGYGAAFWFIIQDLSQLKAVYRKWQGFLANTSKQFFATSDYDTAKYISDSLGQQTIEFETEGQSDSDAKGFKQVLAGGGSTGQSTSGHVQARSLLTPDEVMRLGSDLVIALIRSEPPYALRRINYLTDPDYQGRYLDNPMHT